MSDAFPNSMSGTFRTPWKAVALAALLALCAARPDLAAQDPRPPNLVVIFVDDMGYGDIGPFGSEVNRTPNLDTMAREGTKLTSFYAAPVCTPSRASLMTGCYPKRVGLDRGSWHAVLMPGDTYGIHADEVTVAELLKTRGYATGCIGKWHLGDQPEFLPTRNGFDEFYGLPYSNDMIPERLPKRRNFPPLPLLRGEDVLGAVTDQSRLTADYTREALRFITEHADEPFFLFVSHTMVHVPLHAGERFTGRSGKGVLTDAIEELDWSTGEILGKLRELGLDEHTLVLFTSDNGPARGSAGPLRGRKASTFEGGVRVPCIVRWPGVVPAGKECGAITSTMDLLPTFAGLAGAALPDDRRIDGGDLMPVLRGDAHATPPHDSFLYYRANQLRAVRRGDWKLHVAGPGIEAPQLYHLGRDLGESQDVAAENPDVVKELMALADAARQDLGDGDEHPGENCRPCGVHEDPRVLIPRADGSTSPVRPGR